MSILQSMVEAGSRDPFVWYALAMEYRSQGDLDAALQRYAEVKAQFPAYLPTYLMAAQVAGELGVPAEARRWAAEGCALAKLAGDVHALSELEAELANHED